MITITCVCGTTSKTFKYLKKSDFADGWITDCCEMQMNKDVPVDIDYGSPKTEKEEAIIEVPKAKKSKKKSKKRKEG